MLWRFNGVVKNEGMAAIILSQANKIQEPLTNECRRAVSKGCVYAPYATYAR